MNTKLLRRIERFLLREPRRFDMTEGVKPADTIGSVLQTPPCGTVCCLAGAAYILHNNIEKTLCGDDKYWGDVRCNAIEALNITEKQADRLFLIKTQHSSDTDDYWPERYAEAYDKAKTPRQRVRVAIRRIEHFIKTKGKK
jgi:hypothetical protein